MDLENEEKSCKRRRNLLTEYTRREKDVEKARGPGENCSPESETRSAGQIDDKAPPKKYKAKMAELRQETSVLRHKVQRHATKSQRLSDANSVLMDELRKLCEPHIINFLEANDPNKNPQTDDTNGAIRIQEH